MSALAILLSVLSLVLNMPNLPTSSPTVQESVYYCASIRGAVAAQKYFLLDPDLEIVCAAIDGMVAPTPELVIGIPDANPRILHI